MDFCIAERLGARGAGFHRTGLVHRNAATAHVRTIKHGNRVVGSGVFRHLYEGETTRTLRLTIHGDVDREHLTSLCEVLAEFLVRRSVRDATNKQLCGHVG